LMAHAPSKSSMGPQVVNFFAHRSQYTRDSALKLFMTGLLQGTLTFDTQAAVKALVGPLNDTNQKVSGARVLGRGGGGVAFALGGLVV
jgi:hypothetical protein